jgi:hypothetical protein
MSEKEKSERTASPVRGSLRLNINTSSPKIAAGSDFSIFVVIQNPFDVPITIYQVQTHIPVELIDVNGLKLDRANRESEYSSESVFRNLYEIWKYRIESKGKHTGIAVAVGTDFDPKAEKELFSISTQIQTMAEGSSVIGVNFSFPDNPTAEELDRIFRRIADYKKGLIPVTLQPGDSVVKQFVLRTRNWLFFTPLVHKFQIQVNFASDGIDHTDTISYEQNVQSTIGAMAVGAGIGALVGTLLKSLSSNTTDATEGSVFRALMASILASIAVVVAFARKSTAQPLISVEDFWGGALIGFSVGFFGFEQFFGLFTTTN